MSNVYVLFLQRRGILVLLMTHLIGAAFAQTVTIQGTVRDANGPMEGVTVSIVGSATQTQTDETGFYRITPTNVQTVVFSFVGYEQQRFELATRTPDANGIYTLDVIMQASAESLLDEVVVVGFGTQKKENLTGSVSTVSGSVLENRPVRNAVQALQGMATGLNISQNNGSLENNPSINIRGVGTIGTSSSSPLVLIDGSEGSLIALNPQDIESVSVLKDASAASIYGSRAAFGVILVTTKKGQGRTTVNYNNNLRISAPVLMPKMMDSYTFALYFNEAEVNGNGNPHFSEEHLQRILDYQNGVITNTTIPTPGNPNFWAEGYAYGNDNIDWFDVMYKDQAFTHEHNVSISGSSNKTSYYFSGNYMNQGGMMAFNTDSYDRYAVSAKIETELSDIFTVGYNARLVREDYERPAALTNSFYQDLGRQGWPNLPLYDPNGYLFSSPSPALGMRDGGNDNSTKDFIYQQLNLTFEPIKGWKTIANLNYRTTTEFRHWDSQRLYNHDVNGNPYLYKNTSNVYEYGWKENYYNISIYSEYAKQLGNHHVKGMAGFQVENTAYRNLGVQRDGIIVESLPVLDLTSGTDINGVPVIPSVSGGYQRWATAGFFGRLNYDYLEKYLLEVNLRYDGSSRFRADSRWGFFPSVSAGWNLAKETFFGEALPLFDSFKLRASYGELGNQNTEVWYPTYVTMPTGTANGGWLINNARPNTSSAPGLVSSVLTWESINTINAGVDFALLKGRLSGSFEWFERRTYDMVGPAPQLPVILGTAVPQTNNTDLKTNGFEVSVAWNDRLDNGLGYGIKALLSDYLTTVTRYPNETGSLDVYRAGQKLGEIWGYQTIGIAKTQAEMDAHLASLPNGGQDAFGGQWEAGDVMYADVNGDGKIDWGSWTEGDPGDARVIGNSTPRYQIGLNLNADYKNFDLSVFFQGVLKRDYWQGSYYFWGVTSNKWWSTGFTNHLDYFRTADNPLGENIDGYYPRPTFNTGKNQQTQTRYLQDASYIRLKNLQFGYTVPNTFSKRYGMSKVRIYIAGENLLTISDVAGMFDPETVDGGSGGSVYPLARIWSAGLSVSF